MKNIYHALFMTFAFVLLLAMPVRADDERGNTNPRDLTLLDHGTVKDVLQSDMIMLSDNKRYRLDNILVPPYEEDGTKDEIKKEFLNKGVNVYTYHLPDDENGTVEGVPLVHIVTTDDTWMQEYLVSKGLAWAFSTPTSQQMVNILKLVEEKARQQRRGFWSKPGYAVKSPEGVKDYLNSYQIVEGKIISVTLKSSGTVFFNLSKDWKNGVTLRVKNFSAISGVEDGINTGNTGTIVYRRNDDPMQWKDRYVRVRGWVTNSNNLPLIDLTHKEQVDFMPSPNEQ